MRDEIERLLEEMEEGWQEPGGLDWDEARPVWRRGPRPEDGPEGTADGDTDLSAAQAGISWAGTAAGGRKGQTPPEMVTAALRGGPWAAERRTGLAMDGHLTRPPFREAAALPEGGHEGIGSGLLAGRAGRPGGWPLFLEARRARTAAEHTLRRRETVMVPVPVPAAFGGRAMGAEELDWAFQRDARRYDGGFPFY